MSIEYRDVLVRIEGSGGNYEVSLHHFPLPQDGSLSPIVCERPFLNSVAKRRLEELIEDVVGGLPPQDTLKKNWQASPYAPLSKGGMDDVLRHPSGPTT